MSSKERPAGLGHISTTPEAVDITSLVISHLGLPDIMNVQAKLDKLVVYDTKGNYERRFNSKKELGEIFQSPFILQLNICNNSIGLGTFGTAILQLPVEGGFEGGELKVKYKGRNETFDTTQSSPQDFYLSAYYNCCHQNVEPLKRGCKISLFFTLTWTNSKLIISQDFPAFLTALKKIKMALKPWMPDGAVDEDVVPAPSEEESPDDDADWKDVDSSDDSEDSDEEYEHCFTHHSALEDNVLFFVLEEKYGENNLTFNRLRGNDRNLALLLHSCPFLDVHLAQVTLKSRNVEYNGMSRTATEQGSNEISRWIDSTDTVMKLSMDINWKNQRVGPWRNLLSSRNSEPDRVETAPVSEEDDGTLDYMTTLLNYMQPNRHGRVVPMKRTQYFFRSVLVIWPRQKSSSIYCRYGLPSLLDRIEREATRDKLEEIISFCCVEPQLAWKYVRDPLRCNDELLLKKGELTTRLVRLCINLQAREEGLDLLKILGDSFRSNSQFNSSETYEGIQNEQVAKAIADFVSQIAGNYFV